MKSILVRIYQVIRNQFGIDPIRFVRGLIELPKYIYDLFKFKSGYNGKISIYPCLHDKNEEGGVSNSEYFWQDLLVARKIFDENPCRHVDIGSRIDGFVAHLASFRQVEVFDVRPVTTNVPGIMFNHADMMSAEFIDKFPFYKDYCDSLSCLHAIEHFGLGRYGDPIDVDGFRQGIRNMGIMIKPNGRYYLSTPIGVERVEYNAHRVFDPESIIDICEENGLVLVEITVVGGEVLVLSGEDRIKSGLKELKNKNYSLGIFLFIKHND
jgi:hypothetical protein